MLSQKCNIFEVFGCLIRQKTRFCQNSVPTLFPRKTTKTDHFGTRRNGELAVISDQGGGRWGFGKAHRSDRFGNVNHTYIRPFVLFFGHCGLPCTIASEERKGPSAVLKELPRSGSLLVHTKLSRVLFLFCVLCVFGTAICQGRHSHHRCLASKFRQGNVWDLPLSLVPSYQWQP